MEVNLGVKLHNRFDVVLTDAKTGEVKQVAKAENVVTNQFWKHYNATAGTVIILGTGTGTPAVTDTKLFTGLGFRYGVWDSSVTRLSETEWKRTIVTTFSESYANGTLTEIGLGYWASAYSTEWNTQVSAINPLFTHAMFTDAEGNPISIIKTNSDRLTITVSIYLTYHIPNKSGDIYITMSNLHKFPDVCDPRLPYQAGDSYYNYPVYQWLMIGNNLSSGFEYLPESLPIRNHLSIVSSGSASSMDYTVDTFRNSASTRILSTAGNTTYPATWLVKCINNTYSFVSFPNANVYPARKLTLTRTADGTTTNFNFRIPILNINNVAVYINNTLQSASTYTFSGRDYTYTQAWDSYDTLYLTRFTKHTPNSSSYLLYPLGPVYSSYEFEYEYISSSSTNEYYYDFKTNYTVSAVGKFIPSFDYSPASTPKLYYSNDNETWTEIPLWSSTTEYINYPNIDNVNSLLSVTPVSARYWKVKNPACSGARANHTKNWLAATIVFGDPKPQLKFNTAPPADAEIKIEAYCDYPIKNSNWIIETGMTFDYTFTRQ